MRLVPQVRQALAAAIDTLNGEAHDACAFTVAEGVFVPLQHFRTHGVDLRVALRSLAEENMLAGTSDARARICQHEVRGQQVQGVVVRPVHVAGLDPADFRPPA
jgi:hypothetical protein